MPLFSLFVYYHTILFIICIIRIMGIISIIAIIHTITMIGVDCFWNQYCSMFSSNMRFIHLILQVDALLKTLELQESAQRKVHFALFNCLVIGHTKHKGVQRV